MQTNPAPTGGHVAFVASEALVQALDAATARAGENRSTWIRKLIARELRVAGLLQEDAPVTPAAGKRRTRNN